ncbi:MAG: hypothetical protein ACSLFN_05710 [Candidatus Limnocylindrales bacterium]
MGHDKSDNPNQGVGSQGKGQGQERGQGLNKGQDESMGGWNDLAQREMQQGDRTQPAQPDSTAPLDKDEHPINKNRPVQQNR